MKVLINKNNSISMDWLKIKMICKEIHTVIQIDLDHFQNKKLKIVNQKKNFKCLTMTLKM